MRKQKLIIAIVLLMGLFIFNGLQHPVINMAFSEEEKIEIPIYIEWKNNNKGMYSNIKKAHTEHIINKNEEVVELKEEKSDFIAEIEIDNRQEIKIDSRETFEIIMKNYAEKDIEKAFNVITKYDVLEQEYYETTITHKKVSNYSVGLAVFLGVVAYFM